MHVIYLTPATVYDYILIFYLRFSGDNAHLDSVMLRINMAPLGNVILKRPINTAKTLSMSTFKQRLKAFRSDVILI